MYYYLKTMKNQQTEVAGRVIRQLSRGVIFLILFPLLGIFPVFGQVSSRNDLIFSTIPEDNSGGVPLGNGMLGAMIWKKGDQLRFSLDRADLWDLRTIREFELNEWNFSWVYQRWLKPDEYMTVQQLFDEPYVRDAAPTKIPAAALEFSLASLGDPESVRLSLQNATCEMKWKNGVSMITFIQASSPVGFFRIKGLSGEITPELIAHQFSLPDTIPGKDPRPQGLQRLGYPRPVWHKGKNMMRLHQDGLDGFSFEVAVSWKYENGVLTGVWCIEHSYPGDPPSPDVLTEANKYLEAGYDKNLADHILWWRKFWHGFYRMVMEL
jgi:alpha-L-fucosidase 2